MKIAISVPSILYPEGGIGVYMRNLLNALSKVDKVNEYHLFVNSESENLLDLADGNFKLKNRGGFTQVRWARLLWEHLLLPVESLVSGIDLIHSLMFVAPWLSLCDSVVTIADMTFLKFPQYHLDTKVSYFKKMIPVSAARARGIIAISQSTKNDICEILGIPEDKVSVVYLAPNESYAKIDSKVVIESVLQRWNIDFPYILFVGTIEPRKNVGNLLKAYRLCKTHYGVDHKLVIVGRKGWGYDIDHDIKELGLANDIILLGVVPLDDLVKIYNGAAGFVYPSWCEGFGLPVVEAMACGVPVITSSVSATAEIAGDAAMLVSPSSVEEIAYAINEIILDQSQREQLIAKGLRRVADFSWEKTAKATIEVYDSIKAC